MLHTKWPKWVYKVFNMVIYYNMLKSNLYTNIRAVLEKHLAFLLNDKSTTAP